MTTRLRLLLLAGLLVLVVAEPRLSTARMATTKGVANAALAAAAQRTPVSAIDYNDVRCDSATTIGAWLAALVKPDAAKIEWSGGSCELSNDMNKLDSGSDWCADATITLRHPKDAKDTPVVEIYFDAPKAGKPGPVYAFRAVFRSVNGDDYIRFRKDFEGEWRERFPRADGPNGCKDDDD